MAIQRNPDLPLSWRRPNTYLAINLNNPGAGAGKRLILFAERTSSGQRPAQSIYRANSEQDVMNGSGVDSVARMLYNAAVAQVGSGTVETWIANVDEFSAGAAAVYTLKPILSAANPTGTGFINWSLCGRTISAAFSAADTATTIAANLATAASGTSGGGSVVAGGGFYGLPVASVSASSGVITMTLKTKAAWGEDMPSTFYVSPGLGVAMGGTYVYTTNATGAGSATITVGRTVYTLALSGGETPTQIADGLAAVLIGDGPLAATAATGTLTITYNNDWPIRHVTGKIVTSTGTTINPNGGGAIAAGTNAPNGTIGTGAPTAALTTILGVIDAQALAFKEWVAPWNDSTTLGTINSQIETEGGGLQCRGQRLNAASNASLATAGAIPAATSPALTATTRGAVLAWLAFESGNAAFEIAARIAAAKVGSDRPQQNFNGLVLKRSTAAPIAGPPLSGRSSGSDINSAIQTYCMAPVVWSDALGVPIVEHSRTTSNSSDRALHKWSLFAQLDAQRDKIIQDMNAKMRQPDGTGVNLMPVGTPFSEGIVTLEDFEDVIYEATVEMERAGYYYGADANKAGIDAQQNGSDPGRVDMQYVATALPDIDIVSIMANRAA